MNNPELFIAGIIVTLVVAGALALVLYGAVLDGRSEQADDTGMPVSPSTDAATASSPKAPRAETGLEKTELVAADTRHAVREV